MSSGWTRLTGQNGSREFYQIGDEGQTAAVGGSAIVFPASHHIYFSIRLTSHVDPRSRKAWVSLVQSLAVIALVLTALGLMLRIIKPAVALRRVAAILGIVLVLLLIPCALAKLWSDIPLWQWIVLAAIGVCVWQWWRPRRHARNKRGE